mgnify:CR=1 FL=1
MAGIRTPQQITLEGSRRWAALQGISEEERATKYPSLEESMPVCAQELFAIADRLEAYYKDMQDMEFTIQDGKLWMLQTRNGKRTGAAMVKIAMDLLRADVIDEKTSGDVSIRTRITLRFFSDHASASSAENTT